MKGFPLGDLRDNVKSQVSSHWCQPGLGSKEKCPSLSLLGHSTCTDFSAAPNVF